MTRPPEPVFDIDLVMGLYREGAFPMADGPDGEIVFHICEPRAVIPLDAGFRVRKSLRQFLKKSPFEIRIDTAFDAVIAGCARHGELDDGEIWLSRDIQKMYAALHRAGHAHSVEVWRPVPGAESALVGGLYGIVMGGAFAGESMFSEEPWASQVALVALVDRLRARGFQLLDAQMENDHLRQFGEHSIPHAEYLRRLHRAQALPVTFV